MQTGIYKIINILNNKIYVGSALNIKHRWRIHIKSLLLNKHHSIKLQRAYNKYGANCFDFEIIEECEKKDLIYREQYYIDLYNSFNNGYNCRPIANSNLGKKFSKKVRKNMSKGQSNRSLHTRLNMSQAQIGKKHTEETKNKMSASKKGNKNPLGYKHTDEARKNMGKSHIGSKRTIETRLKMSNSMKGIKRSEEAKHNISKAKKGIKVHTKESKEKLSLATYGRNNPAFKSRIILQFDKNNNFIKEWKDSIELQESNFRAHDILAVCRGKNKTAFGYKWKFKRLI